MTAVVALGTVAACDDERPGATFFEPAPEIITRLSTTMALAGEEVRFELMAPAVDERPVLYATVRWDPTRFEYVRPTRDDESIELTGEPQLGWLTMESRRNRAIEEDWVGLVFIALEDAATTGFHAEATLLADTEEQLDTHRGPQ